MLRKVNLVNKKSNRCPNREKQIFWSMSRKIRQGLVSVDDADKTLGVLLSRRDNSLEADLRLTELRHLNRNRQSGVIVAAQSAEIVELRPRHATGS